MNDSNTRRSHNEALVCDHHGAAGRQGWPFSAARKCPARTAGRRSSTAPRAWRTLPPVGDANWRAEDGANRRRQGQKAGPPRVEKSHTRTSRCGPSSGPTTTTNSGIFIRITDPAKITAVDAYEVNIFDQRPGPEYGTGAIVELRPRFAPHAQGRRQVEYLRHPRRRASSSSWCFNGVETVNIRNDKNPRGPFFAPIRQTFLPKTCRAAPSSGRKSADPGAVKKKGPVDITGLFLTSSFFAAFLRGCDFPSASSGPAFFGAARLALRAAFFLPWSCLSRSRSRRQTLASAILGRLLGHPC